MRKIKSIKIDDRTIIVKELTVQEVLEIVDSVKSADVTLSSFQEILNSHLAKATDLKMEDFIKMAPSEIKEVWDAFKEVNAVFFGTADSMGLTDMALEIKKTFIRDWSVLFRNSSKPVM